MNVNYEVVWCMLLPPLRVAVPSDENCGFASRLTRCAR